MGLRDRFADQFARQKTMTGPEKKANDIIGKLIMKKALWFIVAMIVVGILVATVLKFPWWATLLVDVVILVAAYFFMKKESEKYQEFTPYVGNLISLENKGKDGYTALIKQGKRPIKLDIKYGGEDLVKVKKNAIVQITYNPTGKIAILVTKNDIKR